MRCVSKYLRKLSVCPTYEKINYGSQGRNRWWCYGNLLTVVCGVGGWLLRGIFRVLEPVPERLTKITLTKMASRLLCKGRYYTTFPDDLHSLQHCLRPITVHTIVMSQ